MAEKKVRQTDRQTDRMTNKQTDKRNKKTIAPDRVGDYNKATKQLEGYSRHSRQSSLNNSHVRISHCYYIESKCSGSKTD